MKRKMWYLAGLMALVSAEVVAAGDDRPLRSAKSDNDRFELRIELGRPGRVARPCQAALYARDDGGGRRGDRVWQRALVNEAAPLYALVRDDGRFVVTLDEFRRGGARHAVVIYGAEGQLLRHFLLQDLLQPADWEHVEVRRRAVQWLDGAKLRFDDHQFVIELKWGRTIRIDLRTLMLVDEAGRPVAARFAPPPPDVLGLLFAHLSDAAGEKIAERMAELAGDDPGTAAQTEAVQEALGADAEDVGLTAAEDEGEAAAAEIAAPPAEDVEADLAAEATVDDETAATEDDTSAPREDVSVRTREPMEYIAAAGMYVPQPNPAAPVDYVAWLNELGQIEGPDAQPLYEAAADMCVRYDGDMDLVGRALEGDPDALEDPAIAAWLAANDGALQAFRQGSQLGARGWNLESDEAGLIGVLLPTLSPLRELTRASVADGWRAAHAGDPQAGADRFLDVMAAGAHAGQGMTLIENLVGVAMQVSGADALIHLQADPAGAELDYTELAVDLEAAYATTRDPVEVMQGERAMFYDTVQRVFEPNPDGDGYRVNLERAREMSQFIGGEYTQEEVLQMQAALQRVDFEATMDEARQVYDVMTEAFTQPYSTAQEHLSAVDDYVRRPDANPFVKVMVPSLRRMQYLDTRAQTTRNATLLVTHVNAYHQRYGEYPDGLDVFADRPFVNDPFTSTPFAYRRTADGFELYSLGANGTDEGGVHDRRGETNDIRFWPPPER
jgi:hypothetical protein